MERVFFIAEIGVNHEGNPGTALQLCRAAHAAGASAVKFQTYKAESLAAQDSPAYWDLTCEPTATQIDLFRRHECPEIDFYMPSIEFCQQNDLEFMTTLFDTDLVDIYDPFLKRFKISSSDFTNTPLIDKIISKKKPVIVSCGACSIPEIQHFVNYFYERGGEDLTLLHCVLNYPTNPENANLSVISTLSSHFAYPTKVGYSCHVPMPFGLKSCLSAKLLGASIIEKHFTFSRMLSGNDHYHAFTSEDLSEFRREEKEISDLCGTGIPDLSIQQSAIANARRGLYTTKDLVPGHVIKVEDLIPLRPANAFLPSDISELCGKIVVAYVPKGAAISPEAIDLP